MKTVLVIDDDQAILHGVSALLVQGGYRATRAATGQEALALLSPPPQLIILDVTLPDIDGFEICRRIRQMPTYIPIMMLTARDELFDKVMGLELGADEYVTKPFEPRELLSRVKAMLRFADQQHVLRTPEIAEQPLVFGPLRFWAIRHSVEIDGQNIDLTPTEWSLLELFVTYPGQVFGRETLLRNVWGVDYLGDSRTVDTHVQRLRSKLEIRPNMSAFIQTVRGFGYRFHYSGSDKQGKKPSDNHA